MVSILFGLAGAIAGCGPAASSDPAPSGERPAIPADDGPGDTSGVTTTDPATGSSTAGAPELDCSPYQPPADPWPQTELVLRNAADVPLYFRNRSCGDPIAFRYEIETADTFEPVDGPSSCSGPLPCWTFVQFDFLDECGFACPACESPIIRLDPGAEVRVAWSGTWRDEVTMPAACGGSGVQTCSPRCHLYSEAPAGTYRARVEAFAQCDDECDCLGPDPGDPPGTCRFGTDGLSAPVHVEAVFGHPAVGPVELVFGP